jgi:hypothetical protein
MVRWLDKHILRNLKRLAVFHHTWKEAVLRENLVSRREFTGLKVLYVVFSRKDEREGFDWEGAKKDVVESLEGLVNGDSGWKAPKLIFVDDEGSLKKVAGLEHKVEAGLQKVQRG